MTGGNVADVECSRVRVEREGRGEGEGREVGHGGLPSSSSPPLDAGAREEGAGVGVGLSEV